jgi:hypothetical protein
MRGNIKLFTLSMDLKQANRYEFSRSEKMDRLISNRISVPLGQAPELNA